MGFGGNGVPDKGPGNRTTNPGILRKERRDRRDLCPGDGTEKSSSLPDKWRADHFRVLASQAKECGHHTVGECLEEPAGRVINTKPSISDQEKWLWSLALPFSS